MSDEEHACCLQINAKWRLEMKCNSLKTWIGLRLASLALSNITHVTKSVFRASTQTPYFFVFIVSLGLIHMRLIHTLAVET